MDESKAYDEFTLLLISLSGPNLVGDVSHITVATFLLLLPIRNLRDFNITPWLLNGTEKQIVDVHP
jgi:hypothetical protein